MVASMQRRWTVEDVATYLGVPVKTLYKWRCQCYGPVGVRIGKHLRYDSDEVVAWFDAQKLAS
ncbi:helix-turn-helix domain-containing protein [Kribbella alba]|uniref:Helix-turn-helix domain-containing protein n=1 Tax=Kribbella alba TaxID=190197 RepID=A0ABN2FBE7_9ACTN